MTACSAKVVQFPNKLRKNGTAMLYLLVIVARKKKYISLQHAVKPQYFSERTQKVLKGHPYYYKVNDLIEHKLQLANEAFIDLEMQGRLSLDAVLAWLEKPEQEQDFLKFMARDIERRENISQADPTVYSPSTVQKYKSKLEVIKGYTERLLFDEITVAWLREFQAHLIIDRGNNVNTANGTLKILRTFLNEARQQGLTDNYPFERFKMKNVDVQRVELDEHEYQLLFDAWKKQTAGEKMMPRNAFNVLYWFLIACNTGLRYSDYAQINRFRGADHITFLNEKTNRNYTVRFSATAMELLEKLGAHHVVSLDKQNKYLKIVADKLGISKNLTTHVARRYFAKLCLNRGIPINVVQQLLGHASVRTTESYTGPSELLIKEQFKKLD